MLHDLCCTVCESQFSSVVASAAVLLHLVLMTQTRPFAVQVELVFLGNVSSLAQISLSFSSAHAFCMFSYCLEWSLLLGTFSRICRLLCLEQAHQDTWSEVAKKILLGLYLAYLLIPQKRLLLRWNPHSDCRWLHGELTACGKLRGSVMKYWPCSYLSHCR
jgi:hypothetical protein